VIDNPDGSLHFSTDEVTTALVGFDKALQLSGTQANRQAVLDSIAHHTVLHFSTHGVAEWFTPLQSKLKLSDGYLTLDELLNQQLPGARLAVLSACETGIPGMVLLDEIISLPAGFMQAGVAGVVASLWSVADVSTAMLMARFYELWRKDNLELPEALRQAQLWLRDSTDGEKKRYFQSSLPEFVGLRLSEEIADSFFKAVVFNNPDAHSFAHPFYWAAFTYTGV
jgi:CHAT domain-containing protein